jgi:hypothetical protein
MNEYPPTSDSSEAPAPPPGSVTGDESSQASSPDGQCAAFSVLGHRCPRPAEVILDNGGDPAPICLLHVFAFLTAALDEQDLDEQITLSPLQATL